MISILGIGPRCKMRCRRSPSPAESAAISGGNRAFERSGDCSTGPSAKGGVPVFGSWPVLLLIHGSTKGAQLKIKVTRACKWFVLLERITNM